MIFNTHETVRLTQDFATPAGMIPEGTEGTVLQVFGGGEAYQVEFEGRSDVPKTIPAELLEPV